MPKVKPEYLEQRREQILDAAETCFARRGFHQSTMQDICDEASLSPGAVYRYFRSKEEIIEAMTERSQGENEGIILEVMANYPDTQEALGQLIEIFFGRMAEELTAPEFCALNMEIVSEAPRNPRIRETLRRSNSEVLDGLAQIIRRAQSRGEIARDLSADSVAQVLFAMYLGFVSQKLVDPKLELWPFADVMRAMVGGTFWHGTPTSPTVSATGLAALRH